MARDAADPVLHAFDLQIGGCTLVPGGQPHEGDACIFAGAADYAVTAHADDEIDALDGLDTLGHIVHQFGGAGKSGAVGQLDVHDHEPFILFGQKARGYDAEKPPYADADDGQDQDGNHDLAHQPARDGHIEVARAVQGTVEPGQGAAAGWPRLSQQQTAQRRAQAQGVNC